VEPRDADAVARVEGGDDAPAADVDRGVRAVAVDHDVADARVGPGGLATQARPVQHPARAVAAAQACRDPGLAIAVPDEAGAVEGVGTHGAGTVPVVALGDRDARGAVVAGLERRRGRHGGHRDGRGGRRRRGRR